MWALSRGPVIDAERELIDAARAGDLDSFGKLCERYYAPLAAVAYSVLRDHQLAEDAVQEAFARGLVNLRRLKETGKFAPWLARICRNVAVSSEEPNWEGEEALSVARRWFQEQFGVTFTEETRTMKTCVVQQR
jgi:hypothetical protein